MGTITISIDGREVEVAGSRSILEAALAEGIYIPHLCTHPDLPVQGNCSLCVVEIDGCGRPVKSCETEAAGGMRVITKSQALTKARSVAMELMLAGHPHDCTSCKVYLKCELQTLMQYLGVVNARMRRVHRETNNINNKNPLIVREMERCVQCGRCERVCGALRGVETLRYNKIGWETYIGTENDLPLADSGCRFCGACVEVCPTGALQDAEGSFKAGLKRAESLVPCTAECPAGIDVPRYIRHVKNGQYSHAAAVIREKAPFPHTLGYVCSNRCEDVCRRGRLNSAVAIRELKRHAVENDRDCIWLKNYIVPLADTGRKAAIIGAGPCGLTAAYYLRKKGHEVTVYERLPTAGGMLACGIPQHRLPDDVVRSEIEIIRRTGVKVETGFNVASASELKKSHDAVLVAVGASRGKILRSIPGWDLDGVLTALDILRSVRLEAPPGSGGMVCIIGGGNVAFDCARTLLRMGKSVSIVCVEKGDDIPADKEEIEEAAEEGALLYDGTAGVGIESDGGRVAGLRVADVTGYSFDDRRSLIVETAKGSERVIACDCVVFSAGQECDLTADFGLKLNQFGYPAVDIETLKTSVEGIFASGDAVTGTKFVIDAIAGGRKAASIIDAYLGGDGVIDERLIPREAGGAYIGKIPDFAVLPREAAALRPVSDRKLDNMPVNCGLTSGQAAFESVRCLQCDLRKHISGVKLWTEYSAKGE